MKKHIVWLAACGVAGAALAVGTAQTADKHTPTPLPSRAANSAETKDFTSSVTNPSFEADDRSTLPVKEADGSFRGYTVSAPQGWTLTGSADPVLIVTSDCYTDNNFGRVTSVPDGEQAFYLRMGWNTGTSSLSQNVTLPAGSYTLSAMIRTAYVNGASSSYSLRAGDSAFSDTFDSGSTDVFVSMPWKEVKLNFAVAEATPIAIGIDVQWQSGGSCIMIDNIRIAEYNGQAGSDTPTEADVPSPTEGVITHDFVNEAAMQADLLQMLADFATYMKNDFQECESPNSIGEACGCFKGENTMANNEQGVRPNADLSMICAFLVKYGKDKVTLPAGVSWNDIETMARKSLVFAYSTHKANKLKVCSGNNYWGSTSKSDAVWESSLWAMSVAYSAFFQWDSLSQAQKDYIKAMLVAECNYELERTVPTGYAGDTKAEENGWEADILAATLGMFPEHELAPKWFERLREFAINSYSHVDDENDNTVIDPEYDNTTVAQLYRGKNLYDDYTLQNHNLFHTSYQNVVMQELGEAALALRMFQLGLHGKETWKTNALMHNNQKVMDEVLNWLALADGELAMPNGNDWSLFLFDQITSYSTMACFLGDPNALMLENMAYKFIKARQKTTADGSWLLNADVGARRMGVQAHRVMMTWLMHNTLSTADITPTTWTDFNSRYSEAKVLTAQNVVRASTPQRFTCFSWSTGLKSYTGYFTPNTPDNNKIIVPYRANNTGNILGWYEVNGKGNNATPVVSGTYQLDGDAYVMNGEINTNDAALNNRFALYSTPGNAFIYIDYVRAASDVTIKRELGGLMAISTDPFMKEQRTLYYGDGQHIQTDGKTFSTLISDWVNIDNSLGMVSVGDKKIGFGDRSLNNSINTTKIYPAYSADERNVKSGAVVDARNIVYYSSVDAATTKALAAATQPLATRVPEGWNGVIAPDPDGTCYLILANFVSDTRCTLDGITCAEGAPVFSSLTSVADDKASATFVAEQNHSVADVLRVFIKDAEVTAMQDADDNAAAYLENNSSKAVSPVVTIITPEGKKVSGTVTVGAGACVRVSAADGSISSVAAEMPSTDEDNLAEGYVDVTWNYLANTSFEDDLTYSTVGAGSVTAGTFDPCYLNTVAAASSDFPNVLPVSRWTAASTLKDASPYCRMYSMPYSSTMFCVSTEGNFAAQCPPFLADENAGERVLTVLNSWSSGINRITQTSTLGEGTYRLVMNVRYECPNQTANTGRTVEASGNTNTSYTGLSFGDTELFAYPSVPNEWQRMYFDFELEKPTPVVFSVGFGTSASTGVANNTLMYVDNLRLYAKPGAGTIQAAATTDGPAAVYNLNGIKVREEADGNPTRNLAPGVYIVGNRKVAVH